MSTRRVCYKGIIVECDQPKIADSEYILGALNALAPTLGICAQMLAAHLEFKRVGGNRAYRAGRQRMREPSGIVEPTPIEPISVKTWYACGNIKSSVTVDADRKNHGEYRDWYEDGTPRSIFTYEHGILMSYRRAVTDGT